jgi:hypothetical protein
VTSACSRVTSSRIDAQDCRRSVMAVRGTVVVTPVVCGQSIGGVVPRCRAAKSTSARI